MDLRHRIARRLALTSASAALAVAVVAVPAQADVTVPAPGGGTISAGPTNASQGFGGYVGYIGPGCGAHCGYTAYAGVNVVPSADPTVPSAIHAFGRYYDGSVHLWNADVTGPTLTSPPSFSFGGI
jgi:hypothetical protein